MSGMVAGCIAMALVVLGGRPAYATALHLTNWNVAHFKASGDKVAVDVTFDGTNTVLQVQWVDGDGVPPSGIGIDKFFVHSPVTVVALPTATKGAWRAAGGKSPFQASAFGKFISKFDEPAGTGGITGPLVFTFAGNLTETLTGADDFAAHVRYDENYSGFVSGRSAQSSSDSADTTPVPEASTWLLLGSGLTAVGLWGRKKRVKL